MSRGAGELLEILRDDHEARQRALDAFVEADGQHKAAGRWVAAMSAKRDERAAEAVEAGVRQAELARRIGVAKPVVSLMVKRHRQRHEGGP